jgi:hypothetical protein
MLASIRRYAIKVVCAAVLMLPLTACGLGTAISNGWTNITTQESHPGQLVNPSPCQLSPAGKAKLLQHPARDTRQQWLSSPGLGDLAWSCSGVLYVCSQTCRKPHFVPYYFQGTQVCRIARKGDFGGTQYSYYRYYGRACGTGRLIFKAEDTEGRTWWYDPQLGSWLATDADVSPILYGYTGCRGSQLADVDHRGNPYRSVLAKCLHIGVPGTPHRVPSVPELRNSQYRWRPYYSNTWGWYDISHSEHAPLCVDRYKAVYCGKLIY